LGALIPNPAKPSATPVPPEPTAARESGSEVAAPRELPVDLIDPNPEQPRRRFDPEQLQSLATSIRRHGVLQPVVVRRAGERYELIVGERRWRAARAAGLPTIPVVISDVEPRDRLELAIVENVQRHDLNPIELAHAYRALAEAGATQEEIGLKVALDRSSVANHLRLLELSRELQGDVEQGRLSMGHAKALLQVSNSERQRHLRDRILQEGLSVRAAEQLGREIAGPARTRPPRKSSAATAPLDADTRSFLDRLQRRMQTRVHLNGDGKRGRLEIEYFSAEDLQRIATLLLGQG
jgi:ParB family chromosome partitioning protein